MAPGLEVSREPPEHLREAAARGVIYCNGDTAFTGARAIVAYLGNRGRLLRMAATLLSAKRAFKLFDTLYRAFARWHHRLDKMTSTKPQARYRPRDD